MNLLIVRHAHAEPLAPEGMVDSDRQLTNKGRLQCQQMARTLTRLQVPLGVIVVSPLVRAQQTCEELLRHWSGPTPSVETCVDLAPGGKARKICRFLRGLNQDQLTLIGHMPDLARFTGWMIGNKKTRLHLGKAGMAYLESPVGPGRGHGMLMWLVTTTWFDPV